MAKIFYLYKLLAALIVAMLLWAAPASAFTQTVKALGKDQGTAEINAKVTAVRKTMQNLAPQTLLNTEVEKVRQTFISGYADFAAPEIKVLNSSAKGNLIEVEAEVEVDEVKVRQALLGLFPKEAGQISELLDDKPQAPANENIEQVLEADFSQSANPSLGQATEKSWALTFPPKTFGQSQVKITSFTDAAVEKYAQKGFKILVNPMVVEIDSRRHTRTGLPAVAQTILPKDYLAQKPAGEIYVVSFYKGEPDFYMPESINLDNGLLTHRLYHFDEITLAVPPLADQIDIASYFMVLITWQRGWQRGEYIAGLENELDKYFESLGVGSAEGRRTLMNDFTLALDAADKGVADYQAQLLSYGQSVRPGLADLTAVYQQCAASALMTAMARAPERFEEKYKPSENLMAAAKPVMEGDFETGFANLDGLVKSSEALAPLLNAAEALARKTGPDFVACWPLTEIENAFLVYTGENGAQWGYAGNLNGDFQAVFNAMGGGGAAYADSYIKHYTAHNQIAEDALTDDEKKEILAQGQKNMKQYFDRRAADEQTILDLTELNMALVAKLKESNLFSPWVNAPYFGLDKPQASFSLTDRFRRLAAIEENVLNHIQPEHIVGLKPEMVAGALASRLDGQDQRDAEIALLNHLKQNNLSSPPATPVASAAPVEPDAPALPPAAQADEAKPSGKINFDPSGFYVGELSDGPKTANTNLLIKADGPGRYVVTLGAPFKNTSEFICEPDETNHYLRAKKTNSDNTGSLVLSLKITHDINALKTITGEVTITKKDQASKVISLNLIELSGDF